MTLALNGNLIVELLDSSSPLLGGDCIVKEM